MGFWTDKEKEENRSPFSQQDNQNNQFFSQQFNTFKQCRNDPEDNKFLICKNITQKLNKDGQFESSESEEERIPANEFYNSMSNPFQGISPIFGIMDSLMNQPVFPFNGQNMDINEPKQNSFFGKLKSLFNDDSLEKDIQKYYTQFQKSLNGSQENEEQIQNQQPNAVFQKNFSSSSSSRSCKQDPEDENFLICTTTIKKNINGQQTTEEQQEKISKNGGQQNQVYPSSMHDIFKEMNHFPTMFSPFNFGAPMFNQNQDTQYRQNKDENENRQQNRDNSRKQSQNKYKYPTYEEKKSNSSNGIYDL